jgi:hypothetical protein
MVFDAAHPALVCGQELWGLFFDEVADYHVFAILPEVGAKALRAGGFDCPETRSFVVQFYGYVEMFAVAVHDDAGEDFFRIFAADGIRPILRVRVYTELGCGVGRQDAAENAALVD